MPRVLLLAFFLITIAFGPAHLKSANPQSYRAAVIRDGAEPGVRYSSGLTVCDEALRQGRWVSRYWLSTGMIKPEIHLEGERLDGLPLDAFELALEGQDLAGSWEWGPSQTT